MADAGAAQPIHWDSELEGRLRTLYARCNTAPYVNTTVVGQFFDQHLVIPLMQHISEKNKEINIFKNTDLLKATISLISKTNMVEYEMEFHKQMTDKDDVPAEMEARKEKVLVQWTELEADCHDLLLVLDPRVGDDGSELPPLRLELTKARKFNREFLAEQFGVDDGHIEALYDWAKFRFDCGNYAEAHDYLVAYRSLIAEPKQGRGFSALWGILGADILTHNWDDAMGSLNDLQEIIDRGNKGTAEVQLLQQRSWLIHWSLFVFFNHPQGRGALIELFFQERYINAITTNCPHILRYLTVATIISKHNRKQSMRDLVKVIESAKYMYTDPLTQFVECLHVSFDFDEAQRTLAQCKQLLSMDFFLVACKEEFMRNAQHFIFETYCRIHQCIDIAMLADKLSMVPQEAEQWIVDLVREARLDAKIDSEKNHVIMGTKNPNIYQQVIEKTRALTFKTYTLAKNIETQQYYALSLIHI